VSGQYVRNLRDPEGELGATLLERMRVPRTGRRETPRLIGKKHHRTIPGAVAAGLKTLSQSWGYVAVSPVLAPIGRIQEFKAQRAAGTFRGYGYAVFDVVVTIIVSLALWIFAVTVPLIFAAITYHEIFG
jgi:hypothetical protein